MKNSDGEILVYIGQPWIEPKGTLYCEEENSLVIRLAPIVKEKYVRVSKKGFYIVPLMNYSQYSEWRKTVSGLPPMDIFEEVPEKEQTEFSRFELMDIE